MAIRARSAGGVFGLLAAFLTTAVVLGVLAAGLFMPAVGATGQLAQAGVNAYDSLPSEFQQFTPYQQSRILASDGSVIATPNDQNRIVVPISQIAPIMQQAQVAIEDDRFFQHGGIDVKGTIRGIISPLFGQPVRGGSSITQQYVKMTLEDQALQVGDKQAANEATSRTIIRKLQELKYAVQLEKVMSKDQILNGYLNLAYYGDGAYGVEAAARHYFDVPASKLTLSEAALLAGLTQSPGTTDPVYHPAESIARRDVVLDRMAQLGIITAKQETEAKAVTLKQMLKVQPDRSSCASAVNQNDAYFCEYVVAWLETQPALGATVAERIKKIDTGGLTIKTTLDPKLMTAAKKAVDRIQPGNKAGVGAAAVTIEAGTGRVLSMAQNTSYSLTSKPGQTSINYAVDQKYGGSIGFSVGSTMKAFSLLTAFSQGWAVNSSVYARGAVVGVGIQPPLTSKDLPGPCGLNQSTWSPSNDNTTPNMNISLANATADSVNTAFVALAGEVGLCNVWDTETALGMHTGQGNPITKGPAAIILGSDSIAPETLATAYAALAAQGKYCPARPVDSITGPNGKAIDLNLPPCQQVLSPDVVNAATYLLRGVVARGTGTAAALAGGRQVAGKTGTAEHNTEAWFVGFTPQMATSVWVGTPADGSASLSGKYLPGLGYVGGWGGELAAPIFKTIMDAALAGKPNVNFTLPSASMMNGTLLPIPSLAGMTLDQAKATLTAAGFVPGATSKATGWQPAGTVIGTNPKDKAPKGSAVGIILSDGKGTPPTPTGTSTTTSTATSTSAPPPGGGGNNGNGNG